MCLCAIRCGHRNACFVKTGGLALRNVCLQLGIFREVLSFARTGGVALRNVCVWTGEFMQKQKKHLWTDRFTLRTDSVKYMLTPGYTKTIDMVLDPVSKMEYNCKAGVIEARMCFLPP